MSTLLRFWQVDTANLQDFNQIFLEYKMTDLDGQFALVSCGTDMENAETSEITHKK